MTSALDPRTPCIIGVGHTAWHPADAPEGAPEPLDMWEQVARRAADDAGAPDALRLLESIDVVYSQSWQYDDPAGRLAERLGSSPSRRNYSGIGGSVPQVLASQVGAAMAAGDLDLGLIVGAEALATVRRLKKAGERPRWSHQPAERRPFPMDMTFLPSEVSHAVFEAFLTFALFDNARRAHLGRPLGEHRAQLGRVLAPLTEVAAANPDAWFPVARTPSEIVTATADNRMVAYPYTKLMTAIMDVDMAAAVVMATAARADALRVPEEGRVYLRGSGYAQDPDHVAAHPDLWSSPAMAAASSAALAAAGIDVDAVAHLDLYSCFASSVCFALDALGLAEDDGRGVTQTGGLPYHGGPGSNYMTHALAAMVETLRSDPGSYGMVSGVGMHMTKHVYGVWSTVPGHTGCTGPPASSGRRRQARAVPSRAPEVAVVDSPEGPATVATYSVLHGRDGSPTSALLVCDLPVGARCYATLEGGGDALDEAETTELVGRSVSLTPKDGVNLARLHPR